MPSTSGRTQTYPRASDKIPFFQELKTLREEVKNKSVDTSCIIRTVKNTCQFIVKGALWVMLYFTNLAITYSNDVGIFSSIVKHVLLKISSLLLLKGVSKPDV
ncbi:hypothetical protein OS493_039662 [Desmophyllum pertusum]|uniref:Uncharacterized protein n=1 Tax=Desmophyllum pertusum TaxID=174260 RepID=A0A9W9YHH2_9CNID|nr:hypothetical protein OS493_039662 [Desmophyllum pertusum]